MVKRPRKKQLNSVPIYRADGRVIVGRVEGDIFRKSPARSSVHMLRRPRAAWACDVDALDQARAAGAAWVELFDRDTGATYRVAMVEFYRRGLRIDRGHGAQLALPLECWDVAGGRVTARPAPGQAAAGPAQMRLF